MFVMRAKVKLSDASGDFDIHYPKRFTRLMKCLAHLPYRLYFPLIRRLTGG